MVTRAVVFTPFFAETGGALNLYLSAASATLEMVMEMARTVAMRANTFFMNLAPDACTRVVATQRKPEDLMEGPPLGGSRRPHRGRGSELLAGLSDATSVWS